MMATGDLFEIADRRHVEIEWGDDEMVVWTVAKPREEIGRFTFSHIEGARERGEDDHYRVTHMDLTGPNGCREYLQQGIGREIVRRVGEIMPVVFGPDDGSRPDDGSYLTGMGPGFARRLVKDGLATMDGC